MAAKNPSKRAVMDSKNGIKKIIQATDTSGTMPTNRYRYSESTKVSISDYETHDTYDVNDSDIDGQSNLESSSAAWKWLLNNTGLIITVAGAVISTAALILIFATRLDSKVEGLNSDVKEVKSSVEKLSSESIRIGTEVNHIQRSVTRLENFKDLQKK